MKSVPDNILEKNTTYVMLNNIYFFENHAVYEIMCKNTVEPDRPQMTIPRKRITRWVAKATNTGSECALVTAFPL
jgi:hypothetical protein